MTDLAGLLDDLDAEGDTIAAIVTDLDDDGWHTPTPAVGWTVAHQVAHLAWTDHAALLSATDQEAVASVLRAAAADPAGLVDVEAQRGAATPPAELLASWQNGRAALSAALRAAPEGTRLTWFGPPMGVASMATARLMETWAHGEDVADALDVRRAPTARLRHVAHLGVRTIGFAFAVHQLAPPETPFRVELTGPDGDLWTWGDEDSPDRIVAPALDFCYLVAQRRHPDDLDVTATGPKATEWVPIAQAFAGLPGAGRKPMGAA